MDESDTESGSGSSALQKKCQYSMVLDIIDIMSSRYMFFCCCFFYIINSWILTRDTKRKLWKYKLSICAVTLYMLTEKAWRTDSSLHSMQLKVILISKTECYIWLALRTTALMKLRINPDQSRVTLYEPGPGLGVLNNHLNYGPCDVCM